MKKMKKYDVIIIGGGIIGFSTAMQLLAREPTLKIAVLEKESALGLHQTGRNSGVIHAGVYYAPGSLKAKFCIAGARDIKAFCTEHRIPFKIPGKLITATNEQELIWMDALTTRAIKNGLTVEKLTPLQIQKMQPGLQTVGGFFVKETGIVDWRLVCQKYADLFKQQGGDIFYQAEVVRIQESTHCVTIHTKQSDVYMSDYFIACAGLYADRIAKLSGLKTNFKIVPFRGEYFRLMSTQHDIRYLIYPVPNPALPFLGVHFTLHMDDEITVGPSAVLALAREGYHWGKINLKDCIELCRNPAVWKLIFNNWRTTIDQFRASLFKQQYLKTAKKYFPSMESRDLAKHRAGVRAQAVDQNGQFIQDFLFLESERGLHTCNAPSPAATSSLPIGRHIVERCATKFFYPGCSVLNTSFNCP